MLDAGNAPEFKRDIAPVLQANTKLVLDLSTSYVEAREKAGNAFRERDRWTRMAILNVARMGKFSSDRTVAEYAREIWGVTGSTPLD